MTEANHQVAKNCVSSLQAVIAELDGFYSEAGQAEKELARLKKTVKRLRANPRKSK